MQNWQSWDNGIQFSVPINRTIAGTFNYTIEYYDNQNQFGIFDTVIITIEEAVNNLNNIISDSDDDNHDGGKEEVNIMPTVIVVSIVSGGIVIGIIVVLIKKGIILGSKATTRIST